MPSGMMRSGVVDVINKGPARIRHNLKIQLLFFKIISLICWLGPGSSTIRKPTQHLGIRNIHRYVQISCSQAKRVGGISLFSAYESSQLFIRMKVLNFS